MANNQMENCPVCGTEYSDGTVNVCQTCGWDLTPYPEVLGEIPTSVLQREQTKLTWARGMWAQLQLQSKIMSFEAQQQLAEKERSHIQTQLEELFSQLKETRQLLTSAASSPTTAQVAETQEQLQQLRKERDRLQAQLAQSQAQIKQLNEKLEEEANGIIEINLLTNKRVIIGCAGCDYNLNPYIKATIRKCPRCGANVPQLLDCLLRN